MLSVDCDLDCDAVWPCGQLKECIVSIFVVEVKPTKLHDDTIQNSTISIFIILEISYFINTHSLRRQIKEYSFSKMPIRRMLCCLFHCFTLSGHICWFLIFVLIVNKYLAIKVVSETRRFSGHDRTSHGCDELLSYFTLLVSQNIPVRRISENGTRSLSEI